MSDLRWLGDENESYGSSCANVCDYSSGSLDYYSIDYVGYTGEDSTGDYSYDDR